MRSRAGANAAAYASGGAGTTTTYTASTSIDANGQLINHVVGAGGDFTNDHPIAITYDEVSDLGLQPKATVAAAGLPLFNNKVQCASCHDVHNWSLSPKTGFGGTPFLRIDNNTGSALCVACHKK